MRTNTTSLPVLALSLVTTLAGCAAAPMTDHDEPQPVEVEPVEGVRPADFSLPSIDPRLLQPAPIVPVPAPPPGSFVFRPSPIACTSTWGFHAGAEMTCRIDRTDVASVSWRTTDGGTRTAAGLTVSHVLRTGALVEARVTTTTGSTLDFSASYGVVPYDREDLSGRFTGRPSFANDPSYAFAPVTNGFALAHVARVASPAGLPPDFYCAVEVDVKDGSGWTRSFVTGFERVRRFTNVTVRTGRDGLLRVAFFRETSANVWELAYARATVARPTSTSQWVVRGLGPAESGTRLGFRLRSDDRPVFSLVRATGSDQMRLLIGRTATPSSRADFVDVGLDDRTFNLPVFMGANNALVLDGDVPIVVYDTTIGGYPTPDGGRDPGIVFARATSAEPRSPADFVKHGITTSLRSLEIERVGSRFCVTGGSSLVSLYCATTARPTSTSSWTRVELPSLSLGIDQRPRLAAMGDRPIVVGSTGAAIATTNAPGSESDFRFEYLTGRPTPSWGTGTAVFVAESGSNRGVYVAQLSHYTTPFLDRLH